MKLASFDIFDTVFTRLCGDENNLYFILARQILGDEANLNDLWEFVRERRNAFKIAAKNIKGREIKTIDIYECADFMGLTDLENNVILHKEYDLQVSMLSPVGQTLKIIDKYRNQGWKIAFISDMHLPAEIIKRALFQHGILCEGDDVFVSSDERCSKSSGKLYDQVRAYYEGNIKEWQHWGDNEWSDYKVPKIKKIHPHLCNYSKHLYYDNIFPKYGINQVDFVIDVCKSISKSLSYKDYETDYCHLFIDIVAPLFVTHVYDILADAKKRGVDKLLFFARDSYVLYEIAQCFMPLFPQIELVYFCVSRSTLYLPATDDISVASFMDVKSIKGFTISDYLYHFGIKEQDYPIINSLKKYKNEEALVKFLSDKDTVKQLVCQRQESTKLLCDYYKQQVKDCKKVAIVDLTGTGSSLYALNKIIMRSGLIPVCNAYYLIVINGKTRLRNVCRYQYAMSWTHNSNKEITGMLRVIEDAFALTDQARTTSYKNVNGRIVPVNDIENFKWKRKYLDINLCIFREYTKAYIKLKMYLYNRECQEYALKKLSCFASTPLRDYIISLKEICTSENGSDEYPLIDRPWNNSNSLKWYHGSCVALPFITRLLFSAKNVLMKELRNVVFAKLNN